MQRRRSPRRARSSRGITLIELLTVVLIAAILASLATPSFRQLFANQRLRSATSALNETLWLARAEATKRNVDVGFVFVDAASEWAIEDPAGGGTALMTQDGFPTLVTRTHTGGEVEFSFNAYGRLTRGAGWIELGDAALGLYQCVTVSTTGRTTFTKGTCP
jgi:type IV fimbrial biogenesis protein FimT